MNTEEGYTALPDVLKDIRNICDGLMSGKITVEAVEKSSTVELIENQLVLAKNDLNTSRTSKLWLQYIDMITIL